MPASSKKKSYLPSLNKCILCPLLNRNEEEDEEEEEKEVERTERDAMYDCHRWDI